jgi:hypothetical protein
VWVLNGRRDEREKERQTDRRDKERERREKREREREMKRSQAKFTLVTVSDSTLISSSWTGFSEQRFVEARQS